MEWVSTRMGGGSIASESIVFTTDSKYFFSPSGSAIKMFSVTTGEQTRILKGHTDKVSHVLINPENPLQLYSFGYDRTLRLWDYNDAILLATHNLPFSAFLFAADPKNSSHIFFVAERHRVPHTYMKDKKRPQKNMIFSFNLRTQEIKFLASLDKIKQIVATPLSEFLVTMHKNAITVIDLTTKGDDDAPKMHTFTHSMELHVMAVHPKEQFIAAGDDRGEIVFYHCFEKSKSGDDTSRISSNPVTSKQHWHAHAVSALTFDAEGTHLYSGGSEMVLVIWQLSTGRRDFMPRLGAPICGITVSPDQTLMALRLDDNCVKIINSRSRELEVLVEGALFRLPVRTGLVADPKNNSIAFGSTDGRMQFFSVTEDRSLGRLQVAPRNPVKEFEDKRIPENQVDFIAFSKNGDWMATVDRRPGAPSSALKFWAASQTSASASRGNGQPNYELNTQVMNAHTAKISALAYHPTMDMCATTSPDGKFKIWVLVEREEQQDPKSATTPLPSPMAPSESVRLSDMGWACRSVGFYRDLDATAVAFSPDGSVLAVAYQHIVTLWNPYTNTLLSTLAYAPPYEKIRRLNFLSSGSDLVACTDFNIYVWDLLTASVRWSHYASVTSVAVDPYSHRFAVVAALPSKPSQMVILLWTNAESPKPSMAWRSSHRINALVFQPISGAVAAPSGRPRSSKSRSFASHLVYLNAFDEFFVMEQLTAEQKEAINRKQKRSERVAIQALLEAQQRELNAKTLSEGPSVFKQIYGDPDTLLEMDVDEQPARAIPKIKSSKPKKIASTSGDPVTRKMVERFLAQLDAPSHALPPPSALFAQFTEALATSSSSGVVAENAEADSASKKAKTSAPSVLTDAVVPEPSTTNGEIFNEAKLLEKEAASGNTFNFMKEIFSFARTADLPSRNLPDSVAQVAVPEALLKRLNSISLSDAVLPENTSEAPQKASSTPNKGSSSVKPETPKQQNSLSTPKQKAETPSSKAVEAPTSSKKAPVEKSNPNTPAKAAAVPTAPASSDKKRTKRKRSLSGGADDE